MTKEYRKSMFYADLSYITIENQTSVCFYFLQEKDFYDINEIIKKNILFSPTISQKFLKKNLKILKWIRKFQQSKLLLNQHTILLNYDNLIKEDL